MKGLQLSPRYAVMLLSAMLLIILVTPSAFAVDPVFSSGGIDGGLTTLDTNIPGTGIIDSESIYETTLGWVQFGLAALGLVAFIGFLWAGALYIFSFGSDENPERAKNTMIYTAIGIIVILISYTVVTTLLKATI